MGDLLSQEEIDALLNGGGEESQDSGADETQAENQDITKDEIDAIGEVCNISMGSAATTLSTILDKRVDITAPKVEIIDSAKTFNYKNLNGFILKKNDIEETVSNMCENSLYAYKESISKGYVTLRGGHRVGICGKVLYGDKKIENIPFISSLNIRLAIEKIGCAKKYIPYFTQNKEIKNILVISPPACGKTTLLRDIIRCISSGNYGIKSKKVCVVDERSEIAACFKGVPQNNVGIRTDVLDSCPKSEGINLLVRSMSPEVIATDEIGGEEDSEIIQKARYCGVSVITTAHAKSYEDYINQRNLKKYNEVFDRAIVLSDEDGPMTLKEVFDIKQDKFIFRRHNDL